MRLFEKLKQLRNFNITISEKQQKIDDLNKVLSNFQEKLNSLSVEIDNAELERDEEIKKTKLAQQEIINQYKSDINKCKIEYETQQTILNDTILKASEAENKFIKFTTQLKTARKIYRQIFESIESNNALNVDTLSDLDLLTPTVEIPLNAYNVKDLRDLIKQTNTVIKDTLEKYEKRYTTKSNRALYQLMVLALRSEIQNILTDLKYSTLNKCKNNLKTTLEKCRIIADDGNQTIAGTLKTFIGEIGILFEQLIDIEYQYYIRRLC